MDVLKRLIKGLCCLCRGADPQAANGGGKTPLEVAMESNFRDNEVLSLLSLDSNG